ncbi:hypothetical protein HY792_00345 [Candidatus Desantisbacteria bacterium]|nr:hypothetical protein [Candidatus Desantisbacteria bacterium]
MKSTLSGMAWNRLTGISISLMVKDVNEKVGQADNGLGSRLRQEIRNWKSGEKVGADLCVCPPDCPLFCSASDGNIIFFN